MQNRGYSFKLEKMDAWKVGQRVVFDKMNATIKYIGPRHGKPGVWVELECDAPKEIIDCSELFVEIGAFEKAMKENEEDIEVLQSKVQEAENSLKTEAKKANEIKKKLESLKEQNAIKKEQIKEKFNEKMIKLQLNSTLKLVKLEEELLENKLKEKEIKMNFLKNKDVQKIKLLQNIIDEYQEIEKELIAISNDQENKLTIKKVVKDIMEKQYLSQNNKINKINKEINEMMKKYQKGEKEINENYSVSQENSYLNIKYNSMKDKILQNKREIKLVLADIKTDKDFLKNVSSNFNLSFTVLNLIIAIKNKLKYLNTNNSNYKIEEILHFIDCALFVFHFEINNIDEFNNLINELHNLEISLNNNNEINSDLTKLISLLQIHTPIPLNIAITKHLILATALKCKSNESKYKLISFSENFKTLFHPKQFDLNQDECEELSLLIMEEIHKASRDEEFSFNLYIKRLEYLLNFQKSDFSFINFIPDYHIKQTTKNDSSEKNQEILSLRRQALDLESILDTKCKNIFVLKQRKSKIEKTICSLSQKISDAEEQLQIYEEFKDK